MHPLPAPYWENQYNFTANLHYYLWGRIEAGGNKLSLSAQSRLIARAFTTPNYLPMQQKVNKAEHSREPDAHNTAQIQLS